MIFFSSTSGWIIIILFLLTMGCFLWIFEGEYNILNYGFAELRGFFSLSAWIFIFIIPAITMKSFSEEKNSGTIEFLFTLPLKKQRIIIEKFLGYVCITTILMLFTLVYVFSVYNLGFPKGNLDIAATIGSYLGLFFLAASFVAIGIFTSSVANKQMTAFFIGVFLCFVMYYGLESIASYEILGYLDYTIKQFGLNYHYTSIARGVIDTRDLVYFLSVITFFLWLTLLKLELKKTKQSLIVIPLLVIAINLISYNVYTRIDLTEDNKYSISHITKEILDNPRAEETEISVSVYLDGDFPSGFKRLRNETEILLEEYQRYNANVKYKFVDPTTLEGKEKDTLYKKFVRHRIQPTNLQVEKNGEYKNKLIFPYAEIVYKNKVRFVNLLSTQRNIPQEEQLNNSVQGLEYKLSNSINSLLSEKKPVICFADGHREAEDILLMDAMSTLSEENEIVRIDLSIKEDKEFLDKREALSKVDILIVAKPKIPFNSKEKYLIDQYIMNGGKVIWALDVVYAETQDIMSSGKTITMPISLDLEDFFFKYGVRLNPKIIQDAYCAEIVVQTGSVGGNPQYDKRPWIYYPLLISNPNNTVVKDLEVIRTKYPSNIDVVENANIIKPILKTSPNTRLLGLPREISLDEIALWNKDIFSPMSYIVGIFIEGTFSSAYKNRVKPFQIENNIDSITTTPNKMVVFSDGDILLNEVINNKPIPMNIDKWTKREYGNKDLLLNIVNYMNDNTEIINLRSKKFKLRLLDRQRITRENTKWKVINILLPIIILIVINSLFIYFRKKRYVR